MSDSVSIDPSVQVDGWEVVSESFERLRAECAEPGQYLASHIDELESLVSELVHEREQWLGEKGKTEERLEEATTRLERLDEEFKAVRSERDSLRHEKSLLEAELDHLRRRAAQLAEHLDDERRAGAEQEQHWRTEFRRLRAVLEDLTTRVNMAPVAVPTNGSGNRDLAAGGCAAEPAYRATDAALESVRAQFEMLQKDANRRRTEESGPD